MKELSVEKWLQMNNDKIDLRPEDNMDLFKMIGKVFTKVENKNNYELIFTMQDGKGFRFHHDQDCCENVIIDDIVGDLSDLDNSPLILCEDISNEATDKPEGYAIDDSYQWTFYKFATIKGYVTVKWLGTSNGYYSTSVYMNEF